MQNTLNRLKNTKQSQPPKPSDYNLLVSFPYDNSYASSIKKALAKYDIGTTFQSNHALKSLLTPRHQRLHTFQNVIYKIPCDDCDAFYIGQTCRPLIKHTRHAILITSLIHQLGISKALQLNIATNTVTILHGNQLPSLLLVTTVLSWIF